MQQTYNMEQNLEFYSSHNFLDLSSYFLHVFDFSTDMKRVQYQYKKFWICGLFCIANLAGMITDHAALLEPGTNRTGEPRKINTFSAFY